jgi:hypothetical protein|tara:strand:- start:111 stop:398 length:288 start_codon:yes stop_codon:yes gene_type:complete
MPYVNKPRPYKKEYQQQKARGEHGARMERQRARRKMDKTSKDANKNGVADKREGKDIAHKKALSKGGSNKDGYKVQSRKKNRAAGGAMSSPKKKR